MNRTAIFSTAAFIIVARGAGAGAIFAGLLLLSRGMSLADVGTIVTAQAIAIIAASIGTTNMEGVAITLLPQHRQSPQKSTGYGRASVRTAAIGLPFATLVSTVTMVVISPLTWNEHISLLAIAALVPAAALARVTGQWVYGLGAPAWSAGSQLLLRPVFFVIGVGALAITGGLGVGAVLWTAVIAHLFASIGPIIIIVRRKTRTLFQRNDRDAATWRRTGMVLLLTLFFLDRFPETVTIIAGAVLDEADVALLAIALRIALVIRMLTMSVTMAIGPSLSSKWSAGDHRSAIALADITTIANSAIAIAFAVVTMIAAGPLMAIFEESYRDGAGLLRVLVVMAIFPTFFGPALLSLTALGATKQTLNATIAGLITLIIAMVIGAIAYGSTGLGIGIVLGQIVWTITLNLAVISKTGQSLDLGSAILRRTH